MAEYFVNQPDSFAGILQHQFCEQPASFAYQFFSEPGFDDFHEYEICLIAVHHCRAGIYIGFNWIWLDQALAETVDGRAGEIVDRLVRSGQMAPLILRQTVGHGYAQFNRDAPGS